MPARTVVRLNAFADLVWPCDPLFTDAPHLLPSLLVPFQRVHYWCIFVKIPVALLPPPLDMMLEGTTASSVMCPTRMTSRIKKNAASALRIDAKAFAQVVVEHRNESTIAKAGDTCGRRIVVNANMRCKCWIPFVLPRTHVSLGAGSK